MNRKKLLIGVAALVLVIGIIALIAGLSGGNKSKDTVRTATIYIRKKSFQPASLTIKQGTKVTWIVDDDENEFVLESNPHPDHTDLPGLHSATLTEDQHYNYTFTKTGSFGYHNENDPLMNGSVTVEP